MRRAQNAYFHWCAGCRQMHPLPDSWTFDGNTASPTFSPSFLQFPSGNHGRCHYFVTAGQVAYQADCDHALAGQTVPMADLPEDYRDFLDPVEIP